MSKKPKAMTKEDVERRKAAKASGAPKRGPGPPVTTGRASEGAEQVLIRLSAAEAVIIRAVAGEGSLAPWIRDAALRAAKEGKRHGS